MSLQLQIHLQSWQWCLSTGGLAQICPSRCKKPHTLCEPCQAIDGNVTLKSALQLASYLEEVGKNFCCAQCSLDDAQVACLTCKPRSPSPSLRPCYSTFLNLAFRHSKQHFYHLKVLPSFQIRLSADHRKVASNVELAALPTRSRHHDLGWMPDLSVCRSAARRSGATGTAACAASGAGTAPQKPPTPGCSPTGCRCRCCAVRN